MYMKSVYRIFVVTVLALACPMVADAAFSCGEGYVLVAHKDVDGIDAKECQKLWCRDLENGKMMGSGDRANNGYRDTGAPVELCDAQRNCIMCFGDRKWCSGTEVGYWDAKLGIYTRGDSETYMSYQKSGCFTWRLEKPECANGETAILQGGAWVCAQSKEDAGTIRKSAIRRTGTVLRRMIR